jgi:hypothetical protein
MRGEPADALPPPDGSWFAGLFGFAETDYATVQRGLVVDGPTLTSRANGRRFRIGAFTTPSLGELRARAARVSGAAARVRLVFGDVSVLQGLPENAQATFQVASQFNCLEFVSPRVTPEDGPPFAARTSQAHARFQSHKYRLCAPS